MSMDSIAGSQLLSSVLSQSSSPRLDSDQMSIKSEDESVSKVKLMCSYGGRIMIRPHDSQLRYIGGDTRILVVPRMISYSDLCLKLSRICGGRAVFPKYKLPYEDYDALVSVICEEDLEAMMEEYDRLDAREAPSKLRLFLFPKVKPSGPSLSFDSTEQSFLEVLNGAIDQPQQQQQQQPQSDHRTDFLFGLDSLAFPSSEQEVIIDRPGAASASSSGTSIVQHMIEADSALQSELPPIYTSKPRTTLSTPQPPIIANSSQFQLPEAPSILQTPETVSPFIFPADSIDSSSVQQQTRMILPQIQNLGANIPLQIQNLGANMPSPPVSLQNIPAPFSLQVNPASQLQVLPPRGPKTKVSSPHAPDGSKEKKDRIKLENSGSPTKIKVPEVSPAPAPAPAPLELVTDGMESLRLGEIPARLSSSSPVDKPEEVAVLPFEDASLQSPEIQVKHGSTESIKEMSLNVFMEQQHKEEAKDKIGMIDPPARSFPNLVEHQTIQHQQQQQQQQQTFVQQIHQPQAHQPQPQVQYYHQPQPQPQQSQQPYIIENNMVYFLTDANQLQQHQQTPPVQYIQRPVQVSPVNPIFPVNQVNPVSQVNAVNPVPIQFQRGGSGPLMARQHQLVPPLQRQLSAAYVEQQKQQMQQQVPPRMVYSANRTGPGAQSPSRFREPVAHVPVQVQQFEGIPQVIRPQQVALARGQPYELDPSVLVLPVSQQMPFTGTP